MTVANIKDMALSRIGEKAVGSESTSARAVAVDLHFAHCVQEALRAHRWNFATARAILTPSWTTPSAVADSGSADEFRITKTSHGLTTGQRVTFEASTNYSNLGGTWRITRIDDDTFDLDDSVFNGSGAVDADYTLAAVSDYTYSIAAPSDMLRALEDDRRETATFVQWELESGRILTNSEELLLAYIRDETDVDVYSKDPLFVSVLVLQLAIKVMVALRGTSADVGGLKQELHTIVGPLAKRVDANEGQARTRLLPNQSLFVRARGASFRNPTLAFGGQG